jgi:hypothetical protein
VGKKLKLAQAEIERLREWTVTLERDLGGVKASLEIVEPELIQCRKLLSEERAGHNETNRKLAAAPLIGGETWRALEERLTQQWHASERRAWLAEEELEAIKAEVAKKRSGAKPSNTEMVRVSLVPPEPKPRSVLAVYHNTGLAAVKPDPKSKARRIERRLA